MKQAGWDLFNQFLVLSFPMLSFPRKRESSAVETKLDSRLRGNDSARVAQKVILLLTWLFLALPTPVSAADPVLRLDQAEFILSDSVEPPPDSAPWQPQTLPDNWRATRPDASGYAWYRLRFDLPKQPDEQQAIYIPWLRTVGAVHLNGSHVG